MARLSACRARLTGRQGFLSLDHARLSQVCWFASSGRAVSELGFSARPLLESLTDAYRWYQASGKLNLRGFSRWWMRPQGTVAIPAVSVASPRTAPRYNEEVDLLSQKGQQRECESATLLGE